MEDGSFLFLDGACVATMSDGSHVGQTTTIMLNAISANGGTFSFKVTPSNFLDHSGGSNTKVSIPGIGSSATLMWTGSKWIVTSLIGNAVRST